MPQYQIVKYGDKFHILHHRLLNTFQYLCAYDSLRAARQVVLNWQENFCVDENVSNWQAYNVVWEG